MRHYSKAWLGLLQLHPKHLCVSADLPPMPGAVSPAHCRKPCLGTSGAELSTAHKLKSHNWNLGVGTSCLGTWLKLSRAAQTLQLLPFLYTGASGFVCHVLPQAAILAALDC